MDASENEVFISVVSPVYRAEKILPALCERLTKTLSQITDHYEVILVDDRCPQGSWKVMCDMAKVYPHLVLVRLSRNFGQHYAATAGLDLARGQWTVTMDCDLQDQPEDIPNLLEKAQSGYEVVLGRRAVRMDPILKRLSSWIYYKVFTVLSGYKMDASIGSFRILSRNVVNTLVRMREAYRLLGGMLEWLGFSTAYVDVEHARRVEGKSSYSIRSLLKLSLDGIFAFSNRPLYVSIATGVLISGLSGLYVAYHLLRFLMVGEFDVPGWLSTVTLTAFLGGLILLNQGILGIYVGRIYDQSKRRPLYVIEDIVRSPDTISTDKTFSANAPMT